MEQWSGVKWTGVLDGWGEQIASEQELGQIDQRRSSSRPVPSLPTEIAQDG